MNAFCRRFTSHGIQGVSYIDVGLDGDNEEQFLKHGSIIQAALAFIAAIKTSYEFSVCMRGECDLNPKNPKFIDVFVKVKK